MGQHAQPTGASMSSMAKEEGCQGIEQPILLGFSVPALGPLCLPCWLRLGSWAGSPEKTQVRALSYDPP